MKGGTAASCQYIAFAILVLLLGPGPASAAQSGPAKRPTLRASLTKAKPVIDGKLDEACWKNAATTGPLKVVRGEPSKATTTAVILRDAQRLYIGVRCVGGSSVGKAPAGKSKRSKRKRGKGATGGEYLELSIDSNADGNSYYLIRIVPPKGRITCSYNEHSPPWADRTWQPSFHSAVAKEAGKWSVEFALPLNIFNKNKTLASEIGFNIVRAGMSGQEPQCWHGTPATPDNWGRLRLSSVHRTTEKQRNSDDCSLKREYSGICK